ncbi:MAG TPA: hypothetical protein VN133_04630 [Humibacter sp.]|nr:hypothetical protein [Humibacter sp.]
MTAVSPRQQLTKPIAGGVFVLFWIIAIVLWVFAGVALGNAGAWQPFIVDVGIIFASIGIAALSLATKKGLGLAFLFGVIGVLLFALGDLTHLTPLVYFLRILAPFLAIVVAPTFKLANSVKVFAE